MEDHLMSKTKNLAIENQKLKLENEQLKTLVNCLQSQIHDLVIETAKEELSLDDVLAEITPEKLFKPKQARFDSLELKVGDTVIYCVHPDSLYIGTISNINQANQVFFEDAVYLQFKGQLRLTVHGKDCCIADAVKVILPKPNIPNPKN